MSDVEAALTTLHRAALGDFVAERKRLSAELKAAGDKLGAARIAKVARPPVSVWVVNQLWWQEREAFEALLEVAARVKSGERDASKLHREALARLKELAAARLEAAGNAASEATLRRVTTTLSALAASGGFAPDPEGALGADRDPPGFEALGDFASTPRVAPADQERLASEERARRQAEREQLSASRREAQALLATRQRDLARLSRELEEAEQGVKQTQALLGELDERLASL
ncbi:MAG TPA: hypothetical protein VIW29_07720 [Polyangiaceae bacterium]